MADFGIAQRLSLMRSYLAFDLFSKGWLRTERLSVTRQRRGERGIAQRRYWEHTLTSGLDYTCHVDYVQLTP